MMTVAEFINEQVGRERFAAETGYSQQVISRAIAENVMPAGWYRDVRALAAKAGCEAPDHLFRWAERRKRRRFPPAASSGSGEAAA